MLRALSCSSSGGLRRKCIYAASDIVMTIPEAAQIQLRRGPPEDEQGNARNMQRILINVLYVNKQEFCASSWRSNQGLCYDARLNNHKDDAIQSLPMTASTDRFPSEWPRRPPYGRSRHIRRPKQATENALLTHYSGRVTQICVFNTVKLGTSASSPYCHSTRGNVSRRVTPSSTTRVFGEYFLKISVHKNSQRICYKFLKKHIIKVD